MEAPLVNKKKMYFTNVVIMTFCFFGIFFAFNTSQAMQTSLGGIQGYINLGCLYGVFCVFSLFGPKVVDMWGPKVSMLLGGASYVLVVFSNLWAISYVQIIANLIVGLGAALLWNAEGVYLARCALHDCSYNGKTFGDTTSEYNGFFFSIFQFTGCAGTLISAIIVKYLDKMWLFIILGSIGAISVAMLVFLPKVGAQFFSMVKINPETIPKQQVSVIETLRLLVNDKKVLLSVPIIFYNGMSLAYIFGDISSNVSMTSFGSDWSLYITAAFYAANSLASYVFGKLSGLKKFGRRGSFITAFLLQLVPFVFFIFYQIKPNDESVLNKVLVIIAVVLISFGDAVWESQPPAVLQSFYHADKDRNAAMANYKMWQSLGFCIQFVIGACLSSYTYFWIKTIVIVVGLILGYAAYIYLDLRVSPIDSTIEKIESETEVPYEA
ncbi:hypothetical protein WA158_000179 [Blastocystis sp. Blastoise]